MSKLGIQSAAPERASREETGHNVESNSKHPNNLDNFRPCALNCACVSCAVYRILHDLPPPGLSGLGMGKKVKRA